MKKSGYIFCPNCGRNEFVSHGYESIHFSHAEAVWFDKTNSNGYRAICSYHVYRCHFCDIQFSSLYTAIVIPPNAKMVPVGTINKEGALEIPFFVDEDKMVYIKEFSSDRNAWRIKTPSEPIPIVVSGDTEAWREKEAWYPCDWATYGYAVALADK